MFPVLLATHVGEHTHAVFLSKTFLSCALWREGIKNGNGRKECLGKAH